MDKLPLIDIKEVYNQDRKAVRKLVIIERKKGLGKEEIDQARACVDEMTTQMIDQIRNFAAEDDFKILQVLED